MRILVVDDHVLVRRGVSQLLGPELEDATFAEAGTAREALDLVEHDDLDLMLLDLALPDRGGLELLADVRRLRPSLPIIVVSMYAEEQYAIRALRGGASGFISKGVAPEEIIRAVRKVLAGGRYVSESLAELLAARLTGDDDQPAHEVLSDRELQVLRLIGSGLSVKEIAAQLGLSHKTVSTYRARILAKLGLRTNAALVRYALSSGLLA